MSTRTSQRQLLALKLDLLSDIEVQELLEYVTIMESMRSRVAPTWDDTVEFLAEAQENRRARQARMGTGAPAGRTSRRSNSIP
ncbi:MAG: hypothetical protein ACRD8U_12770 [Pyrinomonadaceae bacterium]